mgnify:CR=1 FL=1
MSLYFKMIAFYLVISVGAILFLVLSHLCGIKNLLFIWLLIAGTIITLGTVYEKKLQTQIEEHLIVRYGREQAKKYMKFYLDVFIRLKSLIGVALLIGAILAFVTYPEGIETAFKSQNVVGVFAIFIGSLLYIYSDKILVEKVLKSSLTSFGFKISCWIVIVIGLLFIIFGI